MKSTLSTEGGAAGLKPIVDALKGLGFKKDDVVDLLKQMTRVEQHTDGDYILVPSNENLDHSYKHDGKSAPFGSGYRPIKKEDIHNLVVGMIQEAQGNDVLTEKDDRCTRIAKRKYDTWPSAYASGAVVRCRRGEIWKGVKEETIDEMNCEHGKYYCNHDKKYKCRKGPKKSR